jgi:anti-sigma B factor antagonist
MLGRLFGRDPESTTPPSHRHTSRAHFGFPIGPPPDSASHPETSMDQANTPSASGDAPARRATFDRLGQTLVATITVSTVTGPEAADLAAEIVDLIRASNVDGAVRHIVLDMQNVQYMDSSCIGVLVELLGRLKTNGGKIALVNASSNVEYLFKLTRLDRVFPICRDVMKAIDAVERQS